MSCDERGRVDSVQGTGCTNVIKLDVCLTVEWPSAISLFRDADRCQSCKIFSHVLPCKSSQTESRLSLTSGLVELCDWLSARQSTGEETKDDSELRDLPDVMPALEIIYIIETYLPTGGKRRVLYSFWFCLSRNPSFLHFITIEDALRSFLIPFE